MAAAISYNINISGSNINGSLVDEAPANNSAGGILSGVSEMVPRKMLAEEATATWCGWCPRGWEWMDYMSEHYPEDFIGIAVHSGDPMEINGYPSSPSNLHNPLGFPAVVIDRKSVEDPNQLENLLPSSLEEIVPVSAEMTKATLDVATMHLQLAGSTKFYSQLSGIDYRMNFILSEDGVTGSGSNWNQANNYSTGGPDPIPNYGMDWTSYPNPVPAYFLEYNHVGRWLSDGYDGAAGSIPSSVAVGDESTYTYEGEFNTEWNPFHMHTILVVTDESSGRVFNANTTEIEVICPANFAETITIGEGSILVELSDPNLGFGGYTYTLNTGQSANVGSPIQGLPIGVYEIVVSDAVGCTMSYSATVDMESGLKEIEGLTAINVFPNPADEALQVRFHLEKRMPLSLEIINALGQVVQSLGRKQYAAGQQQLTTDVTSLANGIYSIKLSNGDRQMTKQFTVMGH